MPADVSKAKKAAASRISKSKVAFEFFAPQAVQVTLAGTFNHWNAEDLPLKKDREGKWRATVSLSSGRYEYRFWVDGAWSNDQKTVECVPNPYGTWNCVLQIP